MNKDLLIIKLKTKTRICMVDAQLISTFAFATHKVQFPLCQYRNDPKFSDS